MNHQAAGMIGPRVESLDWEFEFSSMDWEAEASIELKYMEPRFSGKGDY